MRLEWMKGMAILCVGLLAAGTGCTPAGAPVDKAATAPSSQPVVTLTTGKDKMSYSFGVQTARNFKQQGIDMNWDLVARGMNDVQAGRPIVREDEIQMGMGLLQVEVKGRQNRVKQVEGDQNKQEGAAFLAANKTKEGVVTLPSGLQYKILKAGDGPIPKDTDTVLCHYRGTLIDGKQFDSSDHGDNDGAPAEFKVSGVIAGWREALKLMPVGSKWQLFVPSDLAYLWRGAGKDIGPNATLIFELELVGIK